MLNFLETENYFSRIHHLFPPPSNQTLKLHHKAELGFQLGSGAHRKVTGKWWQKGRKACLEHTIEFEKKHCNLCFICFNQRASITCVDNFFQKSQPGIQQKIYFTILNQNNRHLSWNYWRQAEYEIYCFLSGIVCNYSCSINCVLVLQPLCLNAALNLDK